MSIKKILVKKISFYKDLNKKQKPITIVLNSVADFPIGVR